MILHSLEVENFQILQKAHLTFGRGLNVLFGPNDLGKSSLAEALRTAFLLPVTSSQNREYVPWTTDHVPRVIVFFEVNDSMWKITKEFGVGSRGSSFLERIGESGAVLPEAQGRAVEGKLRELLTWGIPVPGGRGAPRGLPQSYLTTALLGRQEEVTAILDASLENDGVDTGLSFVTTALGALGQDSLVGNLIQRLEDRVAGAFTPAGKVKANGPLGELARKINNQDLYLGNLSDDLSKSAEIEGKVQSLSDQKHRRTEEHVNLQRRLQLLRATRNAQDELQKLRAHHQALEKARLTLAEAEANVETRKTKYEQADAVLRNADVELRRARERLASVSATRDEVLKNSQTAADARQAQLFARREAALRREQAAQEVLQAGKDVESRRQEFACRKQTYQGAMLAVRGAENLVDLSALVVQCQQGNQAIETLKSLQKKWDGLAAEMNQLQGALTTCEASLEEAERIALAKKEALATAERTALDQRARAESLRASLIRAESAEQEALRATAQAKATIASSQRLTEAETLLADLDADEGQLEAKLATNASKKEACEAMRNSTVPIPIRPALVAAGLGVAFMVALGLELKLQSFVIAGASMAAALLGAVVVAVVFRNRRLRQAEQEYRRRTEDLLSVRQGILEERNKIAVKRGVAQLRVDSGRSEWDQAIARMPDPQAALEQAAVRLEDSRREIEQFKKELANLEIPVPQNGFVSPDQVEAARQAALLLKEKVKQTRSLRDAAQQRLAEAQARAEAAKPAAIAVDLVALQQKLKAAQLKVGNQLAPCHEDAQTQLRLANQTAGDMERETRLAEGRLLDAQSRLEGLVALFEKPADQVLAEAVKEREDVQAALECLAQKLSTEKETIEHQLTEAELEMNRRSEVFTAAKGEADEAALARDEAQENRYQAQKSFDFLQQLIPCSSLTAAEVAFDQARNDLETYSPGASFAAQELTAGESLLEHCQTELRTIQTELDAARGQLELVGGAVVREQYDQESEALDGLRKAAEELEFELRATKHLLEVLKTAEAKHAAHLGRSLAKPVNDMFTDLAGKRYRQVNLDPSLRMRNVEAIGGEREIASLSVGTRDQLATLLRLALAAQLKTVLILDDQLAQSDQKRLDWFRKRLRSSVREHQHQIIVITCRPLDYVGTEEMPPPFGCGRFENEEGLTVIDLEQVSSCLVA
jgi:DNA repair exonuclease SbcCD ATPase subunit